MQHAATTRPGQVITWTVDGATHTGVVDGTSGDARFGNAGVRVVNCPCGVDVHRIARATVVTAA